MLVPSGAYVVLTLCVLMAAPEVQHETAYLRGQDASWAVCPLDERGQPVVG